MLQTDFLEPERLRAFVAVAEAGSFSRAAERLGLAQPTVSIQIRRLEESVGHLLFDRKAPNVTLTNAGETMLGFARELLDVGARARQQFSQPPLEGSLRLGLVEDFNYTAFPEFLNDLLTKHKHFELSIKIDAVAALLAQLERQALDMVLFKRLEGSTEGDFVCRQKMVWIGRREVLRTAEDIVPLVLTPQNTTTRELVTRALRDARQRWSIRFEAPTIEGLLAAVSAGIGVTALGAGMSPPNLAASLSGTFLPPLGDVEFAIGLNPIPRDPVVTAFADVIRRLAPIMVARFEEQQFQID